MREYLKKFHGNWYDVSREYSSLFEKRYDLQRQRRMFVEKEVAGKTPSIGYAYLTALVKQNYFNTIFTTNFDDLLNEAFYAYSDQRPIVCAHDSSINSVTVTSKRPKIIKLHGDYLFDDLRSTNRETETLEQNMRSKFTEFAKEYGLAVIGYSGGDRSVMDVLSTLLKNEEYLKGGIYWCIRRDSEVSEELRKLMWRDRVYFVEVDGFDEVFAEMYATLNDGEVLPPTLLSASRRPTDMPTRLLTTESSFPVSTAILRKAKERLVRQSKRAALANLIVKPDDGDKSRPISGPNLNDDELYLLTEVKELISSDRYRQAIDRARLSLSSELRIGVRIRLLRLIVQSHRLLNENREALAVVSELIQTQPKRSSHYQLKASILSNWQDKLSCLDEAIAINPYSIGEIADKARLLRVRAVECFGEEKTGLVGEISELVDRGIQLDPSWRNDFWRIKFDLVDLRVMDKREKNRVKTEIIESLCKQNPYSNRVLGMRAKSLAGDEPKDVIEQLLADISEAKARSSTDSAAAFDTIHLMVLPRLKDDQRLRREVDAVIQSAESLNDESLVLQLVQILRENFAAEEESIKLLQDALEREFDGDLLGALVDVYCDLKRTELADLAMVRWGHYLADRSRSKLKVKILDAKGLYAESIKEMDRLQRESGIAQMDHHLYLLLKLKKWEEAERLARSILEPIHYTPDATSTIVNFEIARKNLAKKVSVERLDAVVRYANTDETHAAVAALCDKKSDAIVYIKKAMSANKSFRFQAMDWPVFEEIRTDRGFLDAIKI